MSKENKIDEIRVQIDKIDEQILKLIEQRADLVTKIGGFKAKGNSEYHRPEREQTIFNRLYSIHKGILPQSSIYFIFREIISACLALEKEIRIAYLGPEATFAHAAALKKFGLSADYEPELGVEAVFEAVDKGRVTYGVVPVENSTEGAVSLTLDLLMEYDLKICGEIYLEISHELLSTAEKLSDVKKVYSHRQGLAQCRKWLASHLPGVPIEECPSTAGAARRAESEPGTAAIASKYAAHIYHLNILASKIEDYSKNFTRFLVIGDNLPASSGEDKTSIMFSVSDEVGALHHMLAPFAEGGINLTKIESRPMKKRAWEYIFFIDCEGHISDKNMDAVLKQFQQNCKFLKVLGSYPRERIKLD